jgi:DNA-binding NarL/FixJ family response regulator
MARLFVIEDHSAIIVAGLKRLFYSKRDGIEVTGDAETVAETVAHADRQTFDVFILDLWLKNRRPVANIRDLRTHFPDKPIIIYTSETSFIWKRRMFDEHAMGYVTKTSSRGEIKKAIETVAQGRVYCPIHIGELEGRQLRVTIGEKTHNLSPVEKEILLMLKNGCGHKEIADVVGKSTSMIEKILKDLRGKVDVKNNFELLTKLGEFETGF